MMNAYKFQVNIPAVQLAAWLKMNNSPKAASTVKESQNFLSTFTIEGNVSALSVKQAFKDMKVPFDVKPTAGSDSLNIPTNTCFIFA